MNGTYPFTAVFPVAKGAAPSNVNTDLTTYQVNVLSRWPDGSVKHAMVSGRAAMTSTPATVTVASGTPASGTALTRGQLETAITAAGDTSISCGAFGAIDVVDILTSGFVRTFVAGHEMVECHYAADVGGGTNLRACFQVRYYADGRLWVRGTVENGKVGGAANADRTYDITITIGGNVIKSGSAMLHLQNTRVTATGWGGGSDPLVTVLHSVSNARASKVVPNYWAKTPTAGYLDTLPASYPLMSFGPYPLGSGAISSGGAGDWIAPQPRWAALYCTTGDVRAQRYMLAAAEAYNTCGIVWRDSVTGNLPRPGNWPTLNTLGSGGGNGNHIVGTAGNARQWEFGHCPAEAYSAWLFTGDYFHYETLVLNAWMCYATNSAVHSGESGRTGTDRLFASQVRVVAWALRNVGLAVACAPVEASSGEDLAIINDWKALLASNYAFFAAKQDIPGINPLGVVYNYSLLQDSIPGTMPAFSQNFWVGVNGWLSDLEPLADMTDLIRLRDWMYRIPVGSTGPTGADNYYWAYAGEYGMKVNDDSNTDPTTYYTSWGTVFQETQGFPNNETTNALQGTSGSSPTLPDGYWGNLLPAISYAVTHGASGAAIGYARITGASNWSTFENAGHGDKPQWGVVPRLPTPPAWYSGTASGEWVAFANSTLNASGVGWAGTHPGGTGGYIMVVAAWGGGVLNTVGLDYGAGFVAGTWLVIWGGGHGDYAGNEIYAFGPIEAAAPQWRRVTDPTIPAPDDVARIGNNPVSRHTYDTIQYDAANNRLIALGCAGYYHTGFTFTTIDFFNFATRTWSAGPNIPSGNGIIEAVSVIDDDYAWLIQSGNSTAVNRLQLSDNTLTSYSKDLPGSRNNSKAAVHTGVRVAAWMDGTTLRAFDLRTPSTSQQFTPTQTGTAPSASGTVLAFDPVGGRFVAWSNGGKTLQFLKPGANPYSGGDAWAWSSVTPAGGATPAAQNNQGTFGRFQWVHTTGDIRGAILMPDYDSPVYFWRAS